MNRLKGFNRTYPYLASMFTAFSVLNAAMLVRDLSREGWQGLVLLTLHFVLLVVLIAPAAAYWREFFRATK